MNNRKAMFVLFLTVFIDLVGFGIVIPLVPLYAEHFGATPHQATILVATYSLMQFLFAPVWGSLSDRYGRRPVLLFSLSGAVIAYIGLGLANSLWLLFVARSLAGAMAGNIATAQAYVADITTAENRSAGMGVLGAAFGCGFIFGPALGGILAGTEVENLNFQLPSFFAAGLSLLALILAFTFLSESLNREMKAKIRGNRHRHKRLANLLKVLHKPQIGLLVGMYFLVAFAISAIDATFALWAKHQFSWGPQQIGYLFALMGVLTACMQGGLIGLLTKRFGEINVLILGVSATGMGFLLIAFSKSLTLVLAACILLGAGPGLSLPTINSLISQFTAATQQGETMGVAQSASALARIVGPTWAGICFALFGSSSPFLSGALAMLAAIALSLNVTNNPLVPDAGIDSKSGDLKDAIQSTRLIPGSPRNRNR